VSQLETMISQQQQTEEVRKTLENIKKDISDIINELQRWEDKSVKEKVDVLYDIKFDIEHFLSRNPSYFSLKPAGFYGDIRKIGVRGYSGEINEYIYENQTIYEVFEKFFEDPRTAQSLIRKTAEATKSLVQTLIEMYNEHLRLKRRFEELKEIVREIEERIDC